MLNEKDALHDVIAFLESNSDIKERYLADIEKFRHQLEQAKLDRYRLGVIGVTSSGKSTMINAIMKKKLLTMAVQPSSSQLVTCSKSDYDQVTVYFEQKSPKIERGKTLDKILEKYGDERFNPGNKLGVKQLEVSSPRFAFSEEILLIDSPGLDAYGFEGHEKLTMNSLLPTVDFCIFVTTGKTNSDEKMQSVLDTIADYDCPLIIVQNMIDSLRPSPDGKKTVNMVAEEHCQRIQRIINGSRIKDKSSVRIIQISSKLALEAYTDLKMSADARKDSLKKSNFNSLIKAVNEIFDRIRPKIEHRRMSALKKQIASIVSEAKIDLQANEEEMASLRFEYAGYNKSIENDFSLTQSSLEGIINVLEAEKARYLSRSSDFTDTVLREITSSSDKAGKNIINTTNKFRDNITKYCDVFGLDARRLRVLDSFGSVPSLKIHTKKTSTRVKKKSFGSGISRFFGKIFRQDDWGYEYVSKDVYDHTKTRESVLNFYDNIIAVYSASCEKWQASAQTQVNILLEQYQNRYDAYEARKQNLLDAKKTQAVIKKLEGLMQSIPELAPKPYEKKLTIEKPDLQKKMVFTSISKTEYAITLLAEKIRINLHKSIFRTFTELERFKNVIVFSWDTTSVEMFVKQSFNRSPQKLDEGINHFTDFTVIIKPDENISELINRLSNKESVFFVLFNTAQFGSGLSDLSRSGINRMLSEKDNVFFVIQDLAELIVGDGIREGIGNMLTIPEKLSMKAALRIMVNHTNPIYNMTACQIQLTPCITHTDEIELLNDIQQRYPYLRDPQIDNNLSEIISGFKTKESYI